MRDGSSQHVQPLVSATIHYQDCSLLEPACRDTTYTLYTLCIYIYIYIFIYLFTVSCQVVRVIGSCEHAQPAISASNNSSCFTSRDRAVMPNRTQAISHFFSTGGLSEKYSLHERNYAMVTFSCNLLTTTELEGELARKAMIHMGLRQSMPLRTTITCKIGLPSNSFRLLSR